MTTTPAQPREGALIEAARARRVPRLSIRKLAELAGISDARWRQIENGYSTPRKDIHVPVTAPAETLARMAQVADVTPGELRKADREDAAKILEAALAIEKHNETTDGPGLAWDPVDEGDLHGIGLALADVPPERRELAMRAAIGAIKALQESN